MGGFTDKDNNTESTGGESAPTETLPNSSRRRFSRSAIAGSAVLLSLGNRAAWGAQAKVGCMSVASLNSFNPDSGHFISAPAGRAPRNEQLAAKIHSISQPPQYLGRSGAYSTQKDPDSLDGVCLYKDD